MDAGRFQRLHEPARKPDRDAVLDPLLAPDPGLEAQHVGLGQRVALDIAEQPLERRILVEIAAAKDDPVADAMLQRNAPLPAGIVRHRQRVGHRRAHRARLDRDRAVAWAASASSPRSPT